MSKNGSPAKKETFRLIHSLQKKVKMLEDEIQRLSLIIGSDERTFSPISMLSPRMYVQSNRSGVPDVDLDWNAPGEALSTVENIPQDTSEIAKTIKQARLRFDRLDRNGSGSLEGNEVLGLAEWCWTKFDIGGRKLKQTEKQAFAKDLLDRTDSNDDGSIDFDEFALWFVNKINKLKLVQREKARKRDYDISDSSEDGLDDEHYKERNMSSPKSPVSLSPPPSSSYGRRKPASIPQTPPRKMSRRYRGPMRDRGDTTEEEKVDPFRMKVTQEARRPPPITSLHKEKQHKYSPSRSGRTTTRRGVQSQKPSSPVSTQSSPRQPLKKSIRGRKAEAGEEPWMVLASYKQPAKNRVQLFLRLNKTRSNCLGYEEIKPILIKCGVQKQYIDRLVETFCEYFGSNDLTVTFKQFEERLEADANERIIYNIVQELYQKEKR